MPIGLPVRVAASAAEGHESSLNPGNGRAIPIVARIIHQPAFYRISMNVISMVHKIHFIPNPVICESSLHTSRFRPMMSPSSCEYPPLIS